jgi:hypothetical protein
MSAMRCAEDHGKGSQVMTAERRVTNTRTSSRISLLAIAINAAVPLALAGCCGDSADRTVQCTQTSFVVENEDQPAIPIDVACEATEAGVQRVSNP